MCFARSPRDCTVLRKKAKKIESNHYAIIDLYSEKIEEKREEEFIEVDDIIEEITLPSTSACCLKNETLLRGINPQTNIIEKLGTKCTYLWKKFWNVNEITLENKKIVQNKEYTSEDTSADNPACRLLSCCAFEYNPFYIPIVLLFLIAQIGITIPTTVGLALKRISACTSKKSKKFYLFIETFEHYNRIVVDFKETYKKHRELQEDTRDDISITNGEISKLKETMLTLGTEKIQGKKILEGTINEKELQLNVLKKIHLKATQSIQEADQELKKWNKILNQLAPDDLKQSTSSYETFPQQDVEYLTFGYKERKKKGSMDMVYN